MDDAGGVCASQRIGNLDGALQSFTQPHPVARNQLVERVTGNPLHRNEVNAVDLADVVDGDDVGMVQRRSRFRFLHEAMLAFGVGNPLRGQHFDGDKAVKVSVPRLVDNAHSSLAQLLDDVVVRNGSTDHFKVGGFRVASSYGRCRGQSTNRRTGSGRLLQTRQTKLAFVEMNPHLFI